MSLCPNCTYQEIENKVNSTVKSYVKIIECDTCKAAREAEAAAEAERRPYLNPDLKQLKLDLKDAFAGQLGVMGGIYAILSSYMGDRNWRGMVTCLNDLVDEGSLTTDQVTTIKSVLNSETHNIDLDNIPDGV